MGAADVFELTGSYQFKPDAPRQFDDRFGHILPVELLAGDIDRSSGDVSDGLRATTRNPGRLWNITGYGGDVERLVDYGWVGKSAPERSWSEGEYAVLFGAHPPAGPRPTPEEARLLSTEMARSVGAIEWQWEDGSAYVGGRSASTTSQALKHWLDRQPAER